MMENKIGKSFTQGGKSRSEGLEGTFLRPDSFEYQLNNGRRMKEEKEKPTAIENPELEKKGLDLIHKALEIGELGDVIDGLRQFQESGVLIFSDNNSEELKQLKSAVEEKFMADAEHLIQTYADQEPTDKKIEELKDGVEALIGLSQDLGLEVDSEKLSAIYTTHVPEFGLGK